MWVDSSLSFCNSQLSAVLGKWEEWEVWGQWHDRPVSSVASTVGRPCPSGGWAVVAPVLVWEAAQIGRVGGPWDYKWCRRPLARAQMWAVSPFSSVLAETTCYWQRTFWCQDYELQDEPEQQSQREQADLLVLGLLDLESAASPDMAAIAE
jgi:hypothetical protein